MKHSNKYFGEALEEIINKKNIKLRSLANKTNLDYSYFSKLKKRDAPPIETIELISQGLKINPEYFFEYRLEKLNEILKEKPQILDKILLYAKNLYNKKEPKIAENKKPFTNNHK